MKKIVSLLLAFVLVLGCLAGCGQTVDPTDAPNQTEGSKPTEGSKTTDAAVVETDAPSKHPITTDPITISILTTRHSNATNNAEDIWFFKYLEYWLEQQGYNVTIEVQQSAEMDQQISLALGTGELPDLIWGKTLSESNAVQYGVEEGLILNWISYINEETMPNLCANFASNPAALTDSTLMDGGVYGLPYFTYRGHMAATGSYGQNERLYIDQKWLDECDLEVPTTIDEFLDTLRAFKNVKLESGEEVIPALANANFLEKYLWIGLGYYGNAGSKYGTTFCIKDGQIELPAATEDYRTFIEIMNTMYSERLISPDHFTLKADVIAALATNGVCGVYGNYGLPAAEDFSRMVSLPPIAIGDNDDVVVSAMAAHTANYVWASADTEYPEVLALIMDYMYSDEGALYYFYGPKQGEDPLGLLDGWYLDENGNATCKLVEDGTYNNMTDYSTALIQSSMYAGDRSNVERYAREVAGFDKEVPERTIKDMLTGEDIISLEIVTYTDDNPDGHLRFTEYATWSNNTTAIRIPISYMSAEDSIRFAELKSVIDAYITAESAKFISGLRPLSELDDYFEELKALEVDEYIDLYRESQSTFIDSTFK